MELSPAEIRVLGCLIKNQRATPDSYPLTLNSLRLACNQTTGREPVVDYDEATVREAAQRLGRRGLARYASGHSGRVAKYRHLADDALGLDRAELALLAVLMLRGAQSPGELKARTERLHRFDGLGGVLAGVETLEERGFARRLERRPGQKEERFAHLLGSDEEEGEPAGAPTLERR